MSAYRVFSRKVWQPNEEWPDGYEPLAVPADKCKTVEVFDKRCDAANYCWHKNLVWRNLENKRRNIGLTPSQNKRYYESKRYEFMEL